MAVPTLQESADARSATKPSRSSGLLAMAGIALLLAASIGFLSLAFAWIENWTKQYEPAPVPAPTAAQPAREALPEAAAPVVETD